MTKSKPKNSNSISLSQSIKENNNSIPTSGMVLLAVLGLILTFALNYSSTDNNVIITKNNNQKIVRFNGIKCNENDYKPLIKGCSPSECKRIVIDDFANDDDLKKIQNVAQKIFNLSKGGSGGPQIWDVNSGALSYGEKFIDIYGVLQNAKNDENSSIMNPLTKDDLYIIENLKEKIKNKRIEEFGLENIFLTSPTFFAQIRGGTTPKTLNDEYWHEHVDKIAYGSFIYTSLLYLSDYDDDFKGGRFVFVDNGGKKNMTTTTIEPKKGRLSIFTSGGENVHYVEHVTHGTRYAFTIAFTCDESKATKEFLSKAKMLLE